MGRHANAAESVRGMYDSTARIGGPKGSTVGSRGDNGSKLLSIDIVDGYINQL